MRCWILCRRTRVFCTVRQPICRRRRRSWRADYRRLTPRDVDLGFAGRYKPGHFVHRAIASLTANDPLHLRQRKGRWELLDDKERTVGRLSQAFTPPKGMTCIEARIAAIINRRREDCEPEYQDHVRCERWEVIIPELVFAPQ